jgi:hypothetical protein
MLLFTLEAGILFRLIEDHCHPQLIDVVDCLQLVVFDA